jgi:Zn-dependent protease
MDSFLTPAFILRIPVVLFALTIHEFAHGWVALRLGDSTALDSGRLTLNPASHLDVAGTIMLMFGPMGWAKPVPVNPYNLGNPRRDIIFVSLAGPVSNILCALVLGFGMKLLFGSPSGYSSTMILFLQLVLQVNLGLAMFNLLPVTPLDGSKVVMGFLPPPLLGKYLNAMRYVPTIFLSMIVIEWLSSMTGRHIPVFSMVFMPLFEPFYRFWVSLIF